MSGYKGVYAKINFPPYKFSEFPKAVKNWDGKTVIVNNQREELAHIASQPDAEPDPVLVEKNNLAEQLAKQTVEMEAMKKQLADLLAAQAPKAEAREMVKLK
jgi:hypothetical protein